MKTNIRFLLILLLATVSLRSAEAQPLRHIANWNSTSSLSNAYVMSQEEDGQGFLWIGTENGLFRLNAYSAESGVWKSSETADKLYTAYINALHFDTQREILWIGSRYSGLFALKLTSGEVSNYTKSDSGLPDNEINDILEDGTGKLWIVTYRGGVCELDPESGNFVTYSEDNTGSDMTHCIECASFDREGRLWLGTGYDGIMVLNPKTRQTQRYNITNSKLPDNYVRGILTDNVGNIWCGTGQGLSRFDPQTGDFQDFSAPQTKVRIMSIAEDNDHRIWLGTENSGVLIFNPTALSYGGTDVTPFQSITTSSYPSVSNKTSKSIFASPSGIIYVGTFGDGVDAFTFDRGLSTVLTTSSHPTSLSQKEVTSLVIDPSDGSVWIGLDGGGIDVIDKAGAKRNYNSSNSAIDDEAVLSAFCDSSGNLWFATYKGQVLRKRPGAPLERIKVDGLNDCRSITQTSSGNLLFGHSSGIAVYDPINGKTLEYNTNNGGARNLIVRSVCVDSRGRIYAGTEGLGLDIYDPQMHFLRHIGKASGELPSDFVNHMIQDSDEVLIATNAGLLRYDFDSDLASELPLPYNGKTPIQVRSLKLSSSSDLWISTSDHIYKYDLEEQRASDYCFMAQGIAGDFYARAVEEDKDGTLYFGSHYGLCSFSPYRLPTGNLPRVRFSSLNVLGETGTPESSPQYYHFGERLILPHKENTFTVTFSVLNPFFTDKVEYAYRLRGLGGEKWYTNGSDNSVTFHNLPTGNYTLEVCAQMSDMQWESEISSISFKVLPQPWLSWWALLLYALGFVGLVGVFAYYAWSHVQYQTMLSDEKKKREGERELGEERMRFFTNITHELRTPLSLIIGPLDEIVSGPGLSEAIAGKLSLVQKNAERLLQLINQILEFRKTETQNKRLCVQRADLGKLIQEIGLRYRELNTNKRVNISTEVEEGDFTLVFDPEAVGTIVDNLMSNACKYTPEGSIALTLRHSGPWTEIAVSDTGIGISKASLPHVFERYFQSHDNPNITSTGIGLALVSNLVKLHEGEVRAESELGKGSTFTFRLLTDNLYPDATHSRTVAKTLNEVYAPEMMDGGESMSRPVILVVEDNEEIRSYLRDSLKEEYLVHTAPDGKVGLEKARQLIPDLIITDVMMPEMDGMEMTQQLKSDVATSHIPIIILTAKASLEDRTDAYMIGAESFIPKPFTLRLIRSRILNILERRKRFSEMLTSKSPKTEDRETLLKEALNSLDKEFVEKVDKLIDDNISEETLDVNFLASEVCMSYSTLYRKLKAITGVSVNSYIRHRKIHAAQTLLLSERYTISEVANMVGINSMSNFRALFKEEFGCSPTEYLKGKKTTYPPKTEP